jgi:hypothetical protein
MSSPAAVLEAGKLRVVFFRQGDRYTHRIELFDAASSDWRPVWESLEGSADEVWPPSPPLQQLHVERRAEGPVALLVGMAGRTHWSAAVEVLSDPAGGPGAPPAIRFDIAARVPPQVRSEGPQSAPRLASTYQSLSHEADGRVLLFPLEVTEFAETETGPIRRRTFVPSQPPAIAPAAQTISWRYRIESITSPKP